MSVTLIVFLHCRKLLFVGSGRLQCILQHQRSSVSVIPHNPGTFYQLKSSYFFLYSCFPVSCSAKRGIIDERKALEQCLTEWEEKGLKNGFNLFSSGKSAPNIGDVSMFGTLQSIDGLQAHSEVISNRVGATKEWYDRMNYLISRETISLE
mmetsp:Transcript_33085/g.98418  ORF Transcript_33085/g.98418 Transcript_33085/m.98418 type:complete len:151 (+) Transcript_33085:692-1144(+)